MIKYTQFIKESINTFMDAAIDMARLSVQKGGGPFGCVIVKDGKIVGKGHNRVTLNNDPTAHAEIQAIRDACKNLGTFQLNGCEIYTSCFPCAMCYGAIYWARLSVVYYASDQRDAADAGFDDDFIYQELNTPLEKRKIPMIQIMKNKSNVIFGDWKNNQHKIDY